MFSLDVQKVVSGEYFTNRYIINAAGGLAQAKVVADAVVENERAIFADWITFDKMRLSDLTPGSDLYAIYPLTGEGDRATTGGHLPLFNCARVDFPTGQGRPSRKYLRIGLTTGDVSGEGVMNSGLVDLIQIAYGDTLPGWTELVDVDGQNWETGVVFAQVAMRQLRRASKRSTPVV